MIFQFDIKLTALILCLLSWQNESLRKELKDSMAKYRLIDGEINK